MSSVATINLFMQYLKFSAAHFTVFSKTSRERLHGHNYHVSCKITGPVNENGMIGDYRMFKEKLVAVVDTLDEYTLIAGDSPYLDISDSNSYYKIVFNNEELLLLKTDTLILPIRNTTIEELSQFLLSSIVEDKLIAEQDLHKIEIEVSSGSGQSCSAVWTRKNHPALS